MKFKYLIKTIILLIIAVFIFGFVSYTLLPYDHESVQQGKEVEYSVRMWKEFYKLKRNEIEIINMGSSHCNCSFVPTIMSKELEVDCINLSTSGATIENIYFQFKEALKSQKPKIVTIELFAFRKPKISYSKFGFEGMRLSLNKINAINYCIDSDRLQDYYFPIVTNRLNWRTYNIKEAIMRTIEHDTTFEYSGYLPMRYHINNPVKDATWANEEEYASVLHKKSLSQEQLRLVYKIIELANKNDIQLIFVAAPYDDEQSVLQYTWINSLRDICKENDIPIINYNNNEKLRNIGIDQYDLADQEHLNVSGAIKFSYDYTKYIKENYTKLLNNGTWYYKEKDLENFENLLDDQQEFSKIADRIFYREQLEFFCYPNAMANYVRYLNDKNYVSFIAAKNLDCLRVDEKIIDSLKSIGLRADFENKDITSYIAVVDGANKGNTIELSGVDEIILDSDKNGVKAMNLPFEVKIISGEDKAEMLIEGFGISEDELDYGRMNENIDQSLNESGFNILVYDRKLNDFLEPISFNTNDISQHYYDRNSVKDKFYNNSSSLNTYKITGIQNALKADNDLMLKVDGKYSEFLISKQLDSKHIVFKAEINSNCNTAFLLKFNENYEKYQLINGDNEVYIEINSNKDIENLIMRFEDCSGIILINDMQICFLDE